MPNPIVLICDDEPDTRKIIRHVLEENFQVEVISFKNGIDVMSYMRSANSLPALLILDLILPDIDGDDIVKAFRSNYFLKMLPIILYSGFIYDVARRAKVVGANEAMNKPFVLDEFIAKVGQYV